MFLRYFSELADAFGQGWNRFWYTPVDPGPLTVLRVLVGSLVLAALLSYTPDLDRFLGPNAILSVDLVSELQQVENSRGNLMRPWRWSYFDLARNARETQTLHWIGLALVGLFTAGVWTRFTSIAALIVFLSYFHRLPMVTLYQERVLAFLLFYLSLGPTGDYLSVDAWLRRKRNGGVKVVPAPSWSANVVLRLIQIHIVVVYVMSALSKLSAGDGSWWNGSAVWWLMQEPGASLIEVSVLRGQTFFMNFWTHAIVIYELAFAVLIWKPIARPLLLLLGFFIWGSVIIATGLTTYALVMLVANVAFFSSDQIRVIGKLVGMCKDCTTDVSPVQLAAR